MIFPLHNGICSNINENRSKNLLLISKWNSPLLNILFFKSRIKKFLEDSIIILVLGFKFLEKFLSYTCIGLFGLRDLEGKGIKGCEGEEKGGVTRPM